MAQDPTPAKASWTRIFSAFKIALDFKKILLAAAGIFAMWIGWWVLSITYHSMWRMPVYVVDSKEKTAEKGPEVVDEEFKAAKKARASWNLMHELAGSPGDSRPVDSLDLAETREEYIGLHELEESFRKSAEPITFNTEKSTFEVPALGNSKAFTYTLDNKEDASRLPAKTTVSRIEVDATKKLIRVDDCVTLKIDQGNLDELKKLRDGADLRPFDPRTVIGAKFQEIRNGKLKPSGRLRASPWHEYRGENPYLTVTQTLKTPGTVASTATSLIHWLLSAQSLVLVEPVIKFLLPVIYFFDPRAGLFDRFFLFLILVWTTVVWGYFGGAICRIAAVQFARGERISMGEALAFTRERCLSFITAPLVPMAIMAIFVFALFLFAWVEWVPYLGDLFAGLFWPIVLVVGLIMAVILVGLIGWPIMIATISAEGTDNFDALSRSYSYIYQAPWQFVWYYFLAIVYGAAVVFFIGFMASLMVFVGKWSVASAPGLAKSNPKSDREPSYLFYYAPTSYGWRDLLISNSQFLKTEKAVAPSGKEIERREFTEEYVKNLSTMNKIGAGLMTIWIYPLFLLVVGFSYSFFWSASTIIYFLMRRYVDETELDEVYQEDEEFDDPFLKPAEPAAPPASKPGAMSLNIVEAPPPSPPPAFTQPPAPNPEPPPSPPKDGQS